MKLVVTFALVFVVGCGIRANPQLTSVATLNGTTTLSYDDTRRVQSVDDGKHGLAFSYSAGHISAMTTTNEAPGNTDEPVETDFTINGGRLTSSDTDFGHGKILNVTVAYDGSGRIGSVTTANTQDGQPVTSTTLTLTYDGDGLAKIHTESNDGTASDVAVAYKNGDVATLTTEDANGQPLVTTTAAYKAGHLATLTTTPTGGAPATTTFKYDKQGRITTATKTADGADPDVTALTYQDGDGAEVDVTPNALFPAALWDLEGNSHNAFDAHTQVPRFAGASW